MNTLDITHCRWWHDWLRRQWQRHACQGCWIDHILIVIIFWTLVFDSRNFLFPCRFRRGELLHVIFTVIALRTYETRIMCIEREQLSMSTLLHDLTMRHDDNLVIMLDSRETMSNGDGRAVLRHSIKSCLNSHFAL